MADAIPTDDELTPVAPDDASLQPRKPPSTMDVLKAVPETLANIAGRSGMDVGGAMGPGGGMVNTDPPSKVPAGVRGVNEAERMGAFTAGEVGGTAVAEATGLPAAPVKAAGAGLAVTGADAAIALLNHYEYGTPIDLGVSKLGKDFLINSLVSAGFSKAADYFTGGVPKEAEAVKKAATESLPTVQADINERAAESKPFEKLAATQERQLGEVSPQAQLEAIEKTTGRTAETVAGTEAPELIASEGATTPSLETLGKQKGLRGVYFNVRNRLGEALGTPYDTLLGKFQKNKVADLSDLQSPLDKWDAIYKQEGRPIPKDVGALMDDARALGESDFNPKDYGYTPKAWRGLSAESQAQIKSIAKKLTPDVGTGPGVPPPKEFTSSDEGAEVGRILGLKRRAQEMMVKSTDSRTRAIAEDIVSGANKSLAKTGGLPDDVRAKLGDLNLRWEDHKHMFPNNDIGPMARTQTPIEAADRIFNNLTLADRVIANAKGDEIKVLRDGFGDWARLHPEKVLASGGARGEMMADALTKSRVFGRLFPGSPLANPNSIVYVGATMQNLESSPVAQRLFQDRMQAAQQEMVMEGSKKLRDIGISAADELHIPALKGDINNAFIKGGPVAAAGVVTQYFTHMTPEKFVQYIAKSQEAWAPSLAQSITKDADRAKMSYLLRRMENPETAAFFAGYGGMNLLEYGRPGFQGTMAILGTPRLIRQTIANRYVQGLADRGAAAELLSGTKAARLGAYTPLARTLLKGAGEDFVSRLGQKISDVTLEMEPEEDEEGAEARP